MRLEPQIMEIGVQSTLAIVVVNLSPIKPGMAHTQLENTRVAAVALLHLRQVADALSVHKQMGDRMIYLEIFDIPFPMEDGSDADSYTDMVHG